jgi:hypothetical protein
VPLDAGGIDVEPELDPPHAVMVSRAPTTMPAGRNFMDGSVRRKCIHARRSTRRAQTRWLMCRG